MASTMTEQIFSPTLRWMDEEHKTGTTIIAVEFKDGVVIGADGRTTTGQYVFNRVTDKLTKITDSIYALRSGSSADTQAICDIVSFHLAFHRVELDEEPGVKLAASVCRNLCYDNRDHVSAGMIVAGWDEQNGGQVYQIPIGGMMSRLPVAIGGSGSTYIYGYLDATFKEGMTEKQCLKWVADGLSLAMNRDGSSGGVIRMASITSKGLSSHLLTGDDIPKFYEK